MKAVSFHRRLAAQSGSAMSLSRCDRGNHHPLEHALRSSGISSQTQEPEQSAHSQREFERLIRTPFRLACPRHPIMPPNAFPTGAAWPFLTEMCIYPTQSQLPTDRPATEHYNHCGSFPRATVMNSPYGSLVWLRWGFNCHDRSLWPAALANTLRALFVVANLEAGTRNTNLQGVLLLEER